jgi:hypothetical protein
MRPQRAPCRAGTIALSGGLIEALDALFIARIPAAWLKTSWEAATLGGWFAGLLQVCWGGFTSSRRPFATLKRSCAGAFVTPCLLEA